MRPGNNVVKQNHSHIPSHPSAPHPKPPYTPASANRRAPPPLSSLIPVLHSCLYCSLSLFHFALSLSLSLSDLGCLLFCSLTLEVHWRRKRGMRKKSKASSVSRTLPDSISPAIAMVAWPQKQPKRSTALEKREIENCRYWMADVRFPKVLLFVFEMTCLSTFELNFMA